MDAATKSAITQPPSYHADTSIGSLGLDETNTNSYNDPAGTLANIDLVQDYQNGVPEAGKLLAVDDGTGPAVPMTPAIVNDGNPGSDPSSIDAVFTFPSWLQLSTAPTGGTAITSGTPIQFSDLTPVDATNQPGVYRIYLKADAPSTADQTITLDEILDPSAGGSGSSGPPATLPATQTAVASGIQASVWQLNYGSADVTGAAKPLFHTIESDDGTFTYGSEYDWEADTATQDGQVGNVAPLAYTASGTPEGQDYMTINAEVEVKGLVAGVTYQIRAITAGDDANANPFGVADAVLNQKGDAVVSGDMLTATVLSVDPLNSFVEKTKTDLNWQIEVAGTNDWLPVTGETVNPTYLMRGDPATPQYLTVIDIGCRDANNVNMNDPVDVFQKIWADFNQSGNGHGVKNAEGSVMTYYAGGAAGFAASNDICRHLAGLMESGDGRCGAWANLFRMVLVDQGIGAQVCSINPNPKLNAHPGLGSALLIIDSLLPGQGNNNPVNRFTDHAVVLLTGEDLVTEHNVPGLSATTVYDPSYGQSYGANLTLAENEELWRSTCEALVGWEVGGLVLAGSGGTHAENLVNSPGINDTIFTPLP